MGERQPAAGTGGTAAARAGRRPRARPVNAHGEGTLYRRESGATSARPTAPPAGGVPDVSETDAR